MMSKKAHNLEGDLIQKDELIHLVATKAGISLADTRKAVDAFADVVCEQVKSGKAVRLLGFATFVRQKVASHLFIPIRGGDKQELPAHHKVRVHIGALLKAAAE